MYTLHGIYTENTSFFKGNDPFDLITEYGSPLYVYNEEILRTRCREIKNLVTYENFVPHYSIKSNTNIHLLKIVHEEGLHADVMSPGEIYLALESGFTPEELFYIPNNATPCDMRYAIERGILTSVDSLSQLEMYGTLNPGGKVAIRFNPGIGAGHHEKVVTAGKKTKFGVNPEDIDKVNLLLEKYNLTLIGINQHIGSLFMNAEPYIQSTSFILEFAKQFDSLEFIDLGGGFGIPYHKQEGEARLDMQALGTKLDEVLHSFAADYGKKIQFQIEPGRYIPCESGIVLGTVTSLKSNGGIHYMGTDIGFNVLQRPIMYGSHHDIELYSQDSLPSHTLTPFTVVGNICESGDILAKDRVLPTPHIGDLIGIMDSGAYGFCMSSSYNQRPRCAEVLIESTGAIRLIRKRETFEDLIRNMLV
ncbi:MULTISPECIES: diaminopimelate decarboxylase [Zhenhengia]|mgnify:FL=1|jgi:diaminopimelate decarboxylase|uniref:diaminopimelate decarboxylase n=1 Tax=Zhenhengia TaxID=2944196 RepID=UPI0015AA4A93|nr:diaminopimelate decarboxylase [Zhenhengia yiwuensis]MDU6361158.1 diaminopimelate decarboxylase [Clostridiales bacterium]MDU7537511.1 diaminopimelate decarboxylase [Peptostreptococcaceae bacterium]MDY3369586.1 diaminopimelate decarboxylase [Zhenhengia yiwuensis]